MPGLPTTGNDLTLAPAKSWPDTANIFVLSSQYPCDVGGI